MNVPPLTLIDELLDGHGHIEIGKDEDGYTLTIWRECEEHDEVQVMAAHTLEQLIREAWLTMCQQQRDEGGTH